jgi:hypothetical protein
LIFFFFYFSKNAFIILHILYNEYGVDQMEFPQSISTLLRSFRCYKLVSIILDQFVELLRSHNVELDCALGPV